MKKIFSVLLCIGIVTGASFAANAEETTKEPESIASSVGALLNTETHDAYISGYSDGTFKPSRQVTRAETAKMFYELLKEKPAELVEFEDVSQDNWYYEPIGALASLGALEGRSEGKFAPGESIKRSEFVTIAARFSTIMYGANLFSDVDEDAWYYRYVISASYYNWIGGYGDGTFRPNEPITRAEAVKVINAMLGRSGDENIADFENITRFKDVKTSSWAFVPITEAATPHEYRREGSKEIWDVPQNDDYEWRQSEEGAHMYYNTTQNTYASGFVGINGFTYYFDPETYEMQSGWTEIDGCHYLLPDREDSLSDPEVKDYLTQLNYRESDRETEDIKYIVVHYTAVPGDTAYSECDYFYNTYRGTSAHYFVDENEIYRCVKDKDIAWHVGNDYYHHDDARNGNTIGIEMCTKRVDNKYTSNPYDSGWYFHEDTKNNTVELIQLLMKKYAVPVESLIRHSDVSQKACPAPFINSAAEWTDFIKRVTDYEVAYNGEYQARILENGVKIYSGPNSTYSSAGTLNKNDVVTVYEERVTTQTTSGRWVRIGDNRWINLTKISRMAAEK